MSVGESVVGPLKPDPLGDVEDAEGSKGTRTSGTDSLGIKKSSRSNASTPGKRINGALAHGSRRSGGNFVGGVQDQGRRPGSRRPGLPLVVGDKAPYVF